MEQTAETRSMDIQRILEMVIRRRKIIFFTAVVVFICSVVMCFTLPRLYESSSTILANSKKIVDPIVSDLAVSPSMNEELRTLSNQVLAWPRLEQLVTQLHLIDPRKSAQSVNDFIMELRKRIKVEMGGEEIIKISYRDPNPVRAQQVVNTITENFIVENTRLKKEDAQNAIDFIESQLKIYQKKLEESQVNFSASKNTSDLHALYNKRTMLEEKLRGLEKIIPSQVTNAQNPVIGRLQARMGELETDRTRLLVDAQEGNPKIVVLDKQIQEIKDFLESEKQKETVKESVSLMNPAYFQTEQDIKQVDLDMQEILRHKSENEHQDVKPLKSISDDELANLERGKKVDEDIYQMLLRRLESAYVSEHLMDSEKGSRYSIIEYARLPHLPVSPKPGRLLLMGLVGGIGAGLGFAFLLEEMDHSFKTLDDARESLPLAYLGVVSKMIPEVPPADTLASRMKQAYENFMNKHQMLSHVRLVAPTPLKKTSSLPIMPEVITVHQPQTMLMEEFRVIKSNIKNLTSKEGPVAIIVTSSLKGEGKSTSAANLAVTMAHSMKNVLLVDADMRRGRLHDLFGVRQGPGLTDVLNGTSALDNAFVFSGVDKLTLITRGQASHNSFDLIDSSKTKSIIDELKNRFDVIIFDTPPVLSLPDTPLLSQLVDGVLLIVQAERTQKKDVINAHRTLEQSHAKVLGFVMTNVKYYIPRSLYQYYYYCENN